MSATKVVHGTGTTSASVTLADGINPRNLIVIDWIDVALTPSSTAAITLTLDGATIAATIIAATSGTGATSTANLFLNFPDGLPVWATFNTDEVPETSVTVAVGGGGTATLSKVTVGYHHEAPSARRSN